MQSNCGYHGIWFRQIVPAVRVSRRERVNFSNEPTLAFLGVRIICLVEGSKHLAENSVSQKLFKLVKTNSFSKK